MDKAFKIIQKVFYGVIILVIVLLVVAMFPIKGNYQIKIVQSGSMEPTIKTGSVVVVKPEASYTIGDIVTFGKDTKKDIPTTHRIVSSRAQNGVLLFSTKGDANEDSDPNEIKQSDIHGKVLFSVPFIGYIIDFVRQPIGFILLIVLPALIVIFDEGAKIWREIKKMREKKAILIFLLALLGVGLFGAPKAEAFYNDVESSPSTFTASSLNFSLTSSNDFSPNVNDSTDAVRNINVVNDGVLGFQYRAKAENVVGGLCANLSLTAALDGVPQYTGTIGGFNLVPFAFSDPEVWQFTAHLDEYDEEMDGTTCTFDLVYFGWRTGYTEGEGGFFDTETISNTVTAGEVVAEEEVIGGVVLNEFLPNPEGEEYGFDFGSDSDDMPKGEWAELYNNGDTDADVTGWYLRDSSDGDGNKTPINTDHILVASPIVPAHGWLVVYINKAVYNNPGDTVRLFDSSDVLVDSYSYGVDPTFCDLEPTPGDNNDSAGSGSCSASNVPGNKSFARIPDGTGEWVDPIPTPGGPNVVEEETPEEESISEEETIEETADPESTPVETEGEVVPETEPTIVEEGVVISEEPVTEQGPAIEEESIIEEEQEPAVETETISEPVLEPEPEPEPTIEEVTS